MPYITVFKAPPSQRQLTLEEALEGVTPDWFAPATNTYDTVTRYVEYISDKTAELFNYNHIKEVLMDFNTKYAELIATPDKSTLYHSFKVPKRSGGLRQIDAPTPIMDRALRELGYIFKYVLKFTYHTNAMAYIDGRSTLVACQRHQKNNSRWRLKTDLHGFFPSSTEEWVVGMLEKSFPLSEYVRQGSSYREEFEKAMSLCFLRGGLPQGSPVSPMITNQMMIPIDHAIAQVCRSFTPHLCYTRYADDMDFSSPYDFNWGEAYRQIKAALAEFNAPFSFNDKKTRYGRMGWMLGVRFSDEGELTVGHGRKAVFRAMLCSFGFSYKAGELWALEDVQHLQGLYAYYKMIEPDFTTRTVEKTSGKTGVDLIGAMKEIIKNHAA